MSEETIPQMRERIEALEKQTKTAEQRATEAESKVRVFEAREVARDQGFSPKTGELFAKVNEGEITPEALNTFATENGLQPVKETTTESEGTSEEADDSGETDTTGNLGAMSGGSSASGSGGQQAAGSKTMTKAEFHSLSQSDPVAARQAALEGRVELRADNPLAVQR